MDISLELDNEYPMEAKPSSGEREPDYPSFHYSGKKELELPDEGEMTIKFKKVSETSSVNKQGEHRYACTIEVQAICHVDGEDPEEENGEEPASNYTSRTKGTEDALDEILTTLQDLVEKDEKVHEAMGD